MFERLESGRVDASPVRPQAWAGCWPASVVAPARLPRPLALLAGRSGRLQDGSASLAGAVGIGVCGS